MSLLERLEKDFVTALKSKQTEQVAVLRMLRAAAKNKQVELRRELKEEEMLDVLARQVKQRQESIEQFSAAGRTDLVTTEERELAILRSYLPAPLDSKELGEIVEATVVGLQAAGIKDMGRVMSDILSKHAGRVDGKELSALVRARLLL